MDGDFFSILGVPRKFEFSASELEARFYALSRELHPDRFATESPALRTEALARMSAVNEAYRTLRDPEGRRRYLLSLERGEFKKAQVPMELAEGWFELQEQPPGLPSTLAKVAEFVAVVREEISKLEARLAVDEASYDASGDRGQLDAIAEWVGRRQTLLSLLQDVARMKAAG